MKKPKGDPALPDEVVLEGVAASSGMIVGPCFLYLEPFWQPEPRVIPEGEVAGQIVLFQQSVDKARQELTHSFQNTLQQLGKDVAEILEMQISFLEDRIFLQEVEDTIEKKHYDAAYATFLIFRQKKEYFLQMSNEYFRERAFDIQHLKEMIIKNILGRGTNIAVSLSKPAIVIANTLSPSDTVQLFRQHVLGMATNKGGKTSHTAIVARSLGVPAVVGLKKITEVVKTGDIIVLDGNEGRVILNPTAETIARYKEQQRIFSTREERLLKESAYETRTKDGKRIHVQANIEFEHEVQQLLKVGADGVGLFRTEGLFMKSADLPSEAEQAAIYSNIARQVYPNKVVIRTLDIGGDKMVAGLINTKEENPFLGWRAIRFWLDHKTGFLAQLKAILQANTRGNVQILLPMISGLGEIFQVRELLEEARETLRKEGKPFGESIDLGIMIEIPSVVVMADILAREVDFFSIGTNDLVQYTLAVDRGNEKVANLYSHFHPAVLRMVKMTIDAGRQANIPVGMCGEMAGDPLAVPILLAMGFENLSASHAVIPEIKNIIRELSLSDCRALYEQICRINITSEVIRVVRDFYREHFPELPEEE